MSRQRLVKPDFFQHEELYQLEASCGLPIRLAFAGLWTQCDRRGLFEWKPGRLKLNVLPFDACDFCEVLAALESAGFVQSYVVDGRMFGRIPTFVRHQSFHVNEKPDRNIPDPPEPTTAPPQHSAVTVQAPPRHSASTSVTGTVTGTVTAPIAVADAVQDDRRQPNVGMVAAFLDLVPETRRPSWESTIDGWRNGMGYIGGRAAAEEDIAQGLTEYLAATIEPDFAPRHVVTFVHKAEQRRTKTHAADKPTSFYEVL